MNIAVLDPMRYRQTPEPLSGRVQLYLTLQGTAIVKDNPI
jgi:hypothetical protein